MGFYFWFSSSSSVVWFRSWETQPVGTIRDWTSRVSGYHPVNQREGLGSDTVGLSSRNTTRSGGRATVEYECRAGHCWILLLKMWEIAM